VEPRGGRTVPNFEHGAPCGAPLKSFGRMAAHSEEPYRETEPRVRRPGASILLGNGGRGDSGRSSPGVSAACGPAIEKKRRLRRAVAAHITFITRHITSPMLSRLSKTLGSQSNGWKQQPRMGSPAIRSSRATTIWTIFGKMPDSSPGQV
jgi:hypothetical protein